jgi:hypothetical protein
MLSGAYLGVPTTDLDDHQASDDTFIPRPNNRSRTPSPRRKKTSGHRGEAGFGSSVINLANTILGSNPVPLQLEILTFLCRSRNIRYTKLETIQI